MPNRMGLRAGQIAGSREPGALGFDLSPSSPPGLDAPTQQDVAKIGSIGMSSLGIGYTLNEATKERLI